MGKQPDKPIVPTTDCCWTKKMLSDAACAAHMKPQEGPQQRSKWKSVSTISIVASLFPNAYVDVQNNGQNKKTN